MKRQDRSEAVETLLEHEMKPESLSVDEECGSSFDCRIQVNLDDRLKKAQFELKGIENELLGVTRAQLRQTCGFRRRKRRDFVAAEQAVLSIESW